MFGPQFRVTAFAVTVLYHMFFQIARADVADAAVEPLQTIVVTAKRLNEAR
jgi:hypothetical protein